MKYKLKLLRMNWFVPCAILAVITFIGFTLVSCLEPANNENNKHINIPDTTPELEEDSTNTEPELEEDTSTKPVLTGHFGMYVTPPEVGDTMFADFHNHNGTGTATWQWFRDNEKIDGATHNNYMVTTADFGKTLKVRVSFSDQSGSITSEATAAVIASTRPLLTGTLTISIMGGMETPQVGDSLYFRYSDGNGSGNDRWYWLFNDEIDLDYSSSNQIFLTAAHIGKTIKVRVSFRDQSGSITSEATAAVVSDRILTGTVTIDNINPKVGDTITANYSDGNGGGRSTWHWLRNGEIIDDASKYSYYGYKESFSSYTVTAADLGATLKAVVSYEYFGGSVTSEETAAVDLPFLTGTVSINNMTPNVSDWIWAAYVGNGTGEETWQWLRNDKIIPGATRYSYTVTDDDLGAALKVVVSYANQNGSVTSNATAAVNPATRLTGTVSINNTTPSVGDTLTATYSGGNGIGTATWQWLLDDIILQGATNDNYTVTDLHMNRRLSVQVSFDNKSGNVTSSKTAAVTRLVLTGTVSINNTNPRVGDTITATYSDGNGNGNVTWRWLRNNTIISGATSNNYTVTTADINATLRARVSYSNQTSDVTSAATSIIRWIAVSNSTFGTGQAIIYGNSKFVAGGSEGKIAYSTDGISWTAVSNSTFGTNTILAIAYGDGKFVAGGNSGRMAYSTDGVTWTTVSNSTFGTNTILAITYGENKFVACGWDGKMAYSYDGITWIAVSNSGFGMYNDIYAITYGDGKFVAVGSINKMAYSYNGITWETISNIPSNVAEFMSITYGNGKFVAVGGGKLLSSGDNNKMAYSTDGEIWTTVSDSAFTQQIYAITYGNGKFIAAGDNCISYSTDGITWEVTGNGFINAITYGNGKFVAVSSSKISYLLDN